EKGRHNAGSALRAPRTPGLYSASPRAGHPPSGAPFPAPVRQLQFPHLWKPDVESVVRSMSLSTASALSKPAHESPQDLSACWDAVQDHLRHAVSASTYAMWFADLLPIALDGEPPTLEVSAPSQYVARTLTTRYFGLLQEAARAPFGEGTTLTVRVASVDET